VADCLATQPDLAYVLGIHAAMPDICRRLIAARIPFVLKKPGAAAVADLAAIRDEAAAAGVPATVALVQRCGPLPQLLGRLGALRHAPFSFVAGPPSRYVDAGCGCVVDGSASDGGRLYLLGVHLTDTLRPSRASRSPRPGRCGSIPRQPKPEAADTEDGGVLTWPDGLDHLPHVRGRAVQATAIWWVAAAQNKCSGPIGWGTGRLQVCC
jgi:predicted dehydrogenase